MSVRLAALAEHGKKIRNVVTLAVFDQIGVVDLRDFFRAINGVIKIAEFVHEPEFERL